MIWSYPLINELHHIILLLQQEGLIKQLQEQHFQQYVRQVYEQQMKQQQTQVNISTTLQHRRNKII